MDYYKEILINMSSCVRAIQSQIVDLYSLLEKEGKIDG